MRRGSTETQFEGAGLSARPMAAAFRFVLRICVAAAVCLGSVGRAESDMNVSKVKALYIYNLVRYCEWPTSVFARTNSSIELLVVGADRIAADLKAMVAGKTVQGRNIEVVTSQSKTLPSSVHLIFLGESEKSAAKEWLSEAEQHPVLTVAEHEGFLSSGGMVSFHMDEGKVKLSVNLKPTRAAGLILSSRLLTVATEVRGRE